jgi:hypothetical protein
MKTAYNNSKSNIGFPILSLLFLLIQACESNVTGVSLKSDYKDDKITLNGWFSADSVDIVIGKSVDALKSFSTKGPFKAANPQVYIENENKSFMYPLRTKDGLRFTAGRIGLKAGDKYRILATAQDLASVETNFIELPQLLRIENLKTSALQEGGFKQNEMNFSLQDPAGVNFYFMDAAYIKKGRIQNAVTYAPTDGLINNCYDQFTFSDVCFDNKRINFRYRVLLDAETGPNAVFPDSLILRFGLVSQEMYLGRLTINENEGIIPYINEPQQTYSNVKNGYGSVCAHALVDYRIPVVK